MISGSKNPSRPPAPGWSKESGLERAAAPQLGAVSEPPAPRAPPGTATHTPWRIKKSWQLAWMGAPGLLGHGGGEAGAQDESSEALHGVAARGGAALWGLV